MNLRSAVSSGLITTEWYIMLRMVIITPSVTRRPSRSATRQAGGWFEDGFGTVLIRLPSPIARRFQAASCFDFQPAA